MGSNRVVALDFETTGLDYYKPEFRVTDLALSWRNDEGDIANHYCQGEQAILQALEALQEKNVTLVVHNAFFDIGCLQARFPSIQFDKWYDTARLAQVGDAGEGQEMYAHRYLAQGGEIQKGLSLVACCSRWLNCDKHNHKDEAHSWIRENVGKNVVCGEHLDKLPDDIMMRYNLADTDNTLLLFENITKQFVIDGYTNFELDHQLYRVRVHQLINSFIKGTPVDAARLDDCILSLEDDLDGIYQRFLAEHKNDILKCIAIKIKAYCTDDRLTDRGREGRWMKIALGKPFAGRPAICGFNINSAKDLSLLYEHVLGIKPPFYTRPNKKTGSAGGNNSFKKAHLPAWHESGKILADKGNLKIALSQSQSLKELQSEDGRWHIGMRATGTKTGRLSGGRD